jgi:hypothetical protein
VVRVNGSENVRHFHDVSNSESVGVIAISSYLIQFSSSRVPERQTITLECFSDLRIKTNVYSSYDQIFDRIFSLRRERSSAFSIRTECSNITFGHDLSAILPQSVVARFPRRSKISGWFSRIFGRYLPIILSFSFPIAFFYFAANYYRGDIILPSFPETTSNSLTIIESKIDWLVEYNMWSYAKDVSQHEGIVRMFILFVSLPIILIMLNIVNEYLPKSSFVIMNEFS